jgi:hypothetical protein
VVRLAEILAVVDGPAREPVAPVGCPVANAVFDNRENSSMRSTTMPSSSSGAAFRTRKFSCANWTWNGAFEDSPVGFPYGCFP